MPEPLEEQVRTLARLTVAASAEIRTSAPPGAGSPVAAAEYPVHRPGRPRPRRLVLALAAVLLVLAVGGALLLSRSRPAPDGPAAEVTVAPETDADGSLAPIVVLEYDPPSGVTADEEWTVELRGRCVEASAGTDPADVPSATLPPASSASNTVAVVRGPGDREVMASVASPTLEYSVSMPPLTPGERFSFHLEIASGDGSWSYRLPREGEFEVVGR